VNCLFIVAAYNRNFFSSSAYHKFPNALQFSVVLQDKKYDSQIGVKSTALRFDEHPRLWMAVFASVMTSGLVATGLLCQQTWPYYLGVGLFAAHVGHQVCSNV